MNYAPAGMPMWARSERTKYLSHISFTFPKVPVDEDDLIAQHLQPRFMFFDESILQLAKLFCTECYEEGTSDLLYGDSLAMALMARLAWLSSSGMKAPKRGGLSARQLKLVTAYMQGRLASQISLAELAGLIGTSRSYFGRAFRVSTGRPPHRWLMINRLERAREYLLTPQITIAQIAQLTGFTHQAHLTRVFRQVIGTTPGAWRRLHDN
jgi:AraC-like DNA-binding protein